MYIPSTFVTCFHLTDPAHTKLISRIPLFYCQLPDLLSFQQFLQLTAPSDFLTLLIYFCTSHSACPHFLTKLDSVNPSLQSFSCIRQLPCPLHHHFLIPLAKFPLQLSSTLLLVPTGTQASWIWLEKSQTMMTSLILSGILLISSKPIIFPTIYSSFLFKLLSPQISNTTSPSFILSLWHFFLFNSEKRSC